MSDTPEVWLCPSCGMALDIASLGFYAKLKCPGCGAKSRVHTLLANFRINGVLGQGGMSVVFSAQDLVLGRELAIKVLNESYRDQPERIARFENECMLMAKVRHENVVSVYSASWARNQFYIAMEKVEGRNLELIVDEHKCLLPDEALDVVHQVAQGLRAAHAAGVLHRDMKPGNIIITPEGLAKVLDFGLSQEDRPGTDQEEIIWATPFYVSPETLQRKPEDARTDIYALGMTLRCLITGVYNLTSNQVSIDELLELKRKLPPMQEAYPHLDERLCDLVDHMTAFDPAERPATYDELIDEINEVRGTASRIDLHKRRRRILRWSLGTVGVLLGGAGAAVGVAYLTPQAPVFDKVSVASEPSWPDRTLMQEAYRSMEQGDYPAAAAAFGRLATEGREPTLRMAAGMLQRMILQSSDTRDAAAAPPAPQASADGQKTAERVAPAAEALHAALLSLAEIKEISREKHPAELEVLSPPLWAAVYLRHANRCLSRGDTSAATEALAAACEQLRYYTVTAPLESSLSQLRHQLPRMTAYAERARARKAMVDGEMREAIKILMHIDKSHFSPAEQAEHDVQREYCAVVAEAFDMLKRHFPNEFSPTASPEDLRSLAARLQSGKLAEEVYVLVLLSRGDYAGAFEKNPYKNAVKSKEPFAVLMKDWQQRLGR